MEKYTIPEAIRILNIKNIIELKIYIILRERNVIDRYNSPIQEYVDDGYLDFNLPKYEVWRGEIPFSTTLVVGERGLNFLKQIIEDYLKENPPPTFPGRKDYWTGTDI